MLTADDVIRSRQAEIFNRVQEIENELQRLEKLKSSLELDKEKLMMEHEILDSYDHRDHLSVTTTTTTTTFKMRSSDKLTIEDTLRKIFDNAGRPMRMVEVIGELEKFGYQWSRYESAHSYISRLPHIEKVPQTRGMYQWVRVTM